MSIILSMSPYFKYILSIFKYINSIIKERKNYMVEKKDNLEKLRLITGHSSSEVIVKRYIKVPIPNLDKIIKKMLKNNIQ